MKEELRVKDKCKIKMCYADLCNLVCVMAGLGFTFFKLSLANQIPIRALPMAIYDDKNMIDNAYHILSGQWLGTYNQMTLCKGFFFPWYLACIKRMGVPYILTTNILYCISCFFFILAIRKVISNRFILLGGYIILIFNPVMTSWGVMQRVYRCCLTPIQVLMVFSGFIGMYLRHEEKANKQIGWSVLAAVGLTTMYFTREDAIWIFPFVLVVTCVLIGIELSKKCDLLSTLKKLFLYFFPVIFFIASIATIKTINYQKYGIAVTTDVSEKNFGEAMKAIYSIEDSQEKKYVSVSRDKMKKIYSLSDTLYQIWPVMENYLNAFAGEEDGEVDDAHFYWCFRDAVASAGYYEDAKKAAAFYGAVANELNQAIRDRKVESRAVMPSALMSPWRSYYLQEMLEQQKTAWGYIFTFKDINTQMESSFDGGIDEISRFEEITNNKALFTEDEKAIYKQMKKTCVKLNGIARVYTNCNTALSLVSMFCFIGIIVRMLVKKFTDKKENSVCLCMWGLLLSLVVLIEGVTYTHVSAYPAISYMYLSGAYPIVLMLEIIALGVVLDRVFDRCNKLKKGQEEL